MTEVELNNIKAMWESGASLEQIYQMLPCRRYTAYKLVRELRDEGILKPRKRTERAIKAVALAWETETKNPDELSEIFGYTKTTINTYLQKSGVRQGKRQAMNFNHCELTNKIVDELNSGAKMSEIASKFGVSRQYVFKIKKRLEKNNGTDDEHI